MNLLAGAAQELGMFRQQTSPAQELAGAVQSSTTNNAFGGTSLTFSPRIDIAPGQSNAGDVRQAVSDALAQAQEQFREWAADMAYQNARVAMR